MPAAAHQRVCVPGVVSESLMIRRAARGIPDEGVVPCCDNVNLP